MSYQEFMPDELRAQVRDRLCEVLAEIARGGTVPARQADDALLREMMAIATGEAVPDQYIAMMREDLTDDSLPSRSLKWRKAPDPAALQGTEVVIIGAGMSGLYAGIQLREAGIASVILEKNDAVGGTWYENIYPGCGVDTPNHFYSCAFEPNYDWSHFFAKRDELWNYFERVADKYDLRKHIRLGTDDRELHDLWGADDAKAYLGLTVPGFPNFFMLTSPNTGLAHGGNQIFMTECGVRHMMLALRELLEGGHRSIECKPEVYENYNREVDAMHARMVWTHKA
jgi:cation diffusion facilitator CzcD-associated flavoprotein CzcO